MIENSEDSRLAALGPANEPNDEQCAAVARLIQTHAYDQADADLITDAILGPLTTTRDADPVHNYAHYMRGCRHPTCVAANTDYQRRRNSGRIAKYGAAS